MTATSIVVETAVKLAEGGIPVFPVWSVDAGRCACGKTDCESPGKHPQGALVPHGVKDASTDPAVIWRWFEHSPNANLGVATGHKLPKGGYLVVLDVDSGRDGHKSLAALEEQHGQLPRAIAVRSGGGGIHIWMTAPESLRKTKDKLGVGLEVFGRGVYVVSPPSSHVSGRRYKWPTSFDPSLLQLIGPPAAPSWFVEAANGTEVREFGASERERMNGAEGVIPDGSRNDTLTRIAGAIRRQGHDRVIIEAALAGVSELACETPLEDAEVRRIAKSIARYPSGEPNAPAPKPPWPVLARPALYGLAGDIVRALEPHSEADPAALLMQTLCAFGNLAGRESFVHVEADLHPPGLYVTIVGDTSKARKGTSLGRVRSVLQPASPRWWKECVTGGAISGEGLIWEVRDATYKPAEAKDGEPLPESVTEQRGEVIELGVSDKRRLWTAGEFASMLKVISRDSNTLSATLREFWDTGDHRTAAKNNPVRATGAHTSIIAHVTAEELRRLLNETETANGFANRFLFVCARRSKALPETTNPDPSVLTSLAERTAKAARYAHEGHELNRDERARQLWAQEYERLSAGRPGLLGMITSRAEAQVTRLALIYALLDHAPAITADHLRAALAAWSYCDQSAAWVFGDALGDSIADRLLGYLRENQTGLTRTDIRARLGGRVDASRIDSALDLLERLGLATPEREPTGGRAAQRWSAVVERGSVEQA